MINQSMELFDPVKKQVGEMVAKANSLTVTDEASKDQSITVGKSLTQVEKSAEKVYKEVTKDAQAFIVKVRDYKKSIVAQTTEAKNNIKRELMKYEKELAKKRAEMERKLAEEKRKAEEEAKALAAKDVTPQSSGWDQFSAPEEKAIEKAQREVERKVELDQFKAEKKSEIKAKEKEIAATKVKGTTTVWNFKITDETKVPREFLSVDNAKIRAFMRTEDLSEITPRMGIEFFQETRMSLR